jgi:hypothetical protein
MEKAKPCTTNLVLERYFERSRIQDEFVATAYELAAPILRKRVAVEERRDCAGECVGHYSKQVAGG